MSRVLGTGVLLFFVAGPGAAFASEAAPSRTQDVVPTISPALMEEFQKDVDWFLEVGADYKSEINSGVRGELLRRRDFLNRSFDRLISQKDSELNDRRQNAIAYFEAFVRKYPGHLDYTPDAMFRLGELYFENASVRFEQDMNA